MKMYLFLLVGMSTLFLLSTSCVASDNSWAMTPELYQEHMQREDDFNNQMYRILAEEIKTRRNNPYYNCQFISNVKAKDVEEARHIAIGLGATHFQLGLVTNTSTTGTAYKCP